MNLFHAQVFIDGRPVYEAPIQASTFHTAAARAAKEAKKKVKWRVKQLTVRLTKS